MNRKNSRQSLVSKEHQLDFALHANSGNGPLSIALFFFSRQSRLINYFVHSVQNMVFLTEDAIFEARGIGSDG